MGKTILIYTLIASCVMSLHYWSLKIRPYRWLVNSIIHPYHKWLLRRKFKSLTDDETNKLYLGYNDLNVWYKKYWFYTSLLNVIAKEIEKRNKLNK